MTTDRELDLKMLLYDLLVLKEESKRAGVILDALNRMILRAESALSEEDVEYVKRKISTLKTQQ